RCATLSGQLLPRRLDLVAAGHGGGQRLLAQQTASVRVARRSLDGLRLRDSLAVQPVCEQARLDLHQRCVVESRHVGLDLIEAEVAKQLRQLRTFEAVFLCQFEDADLAQARSSRSREATTKR